MKNLRKKENLGELLESSKTFLVTVSYTVQQNFNPQDFPKDFLEVGLVVESVFTQTHQAYRVKAPDALDAENHIRWFIEENLAFNNKQYELRCEELDPEEVNLNPSEDALRFISNLPESESVPEDGSADATSDISTDVN